LQRTYGNQALILKDWGRLEEAFELHKKEEALCVQLGNRSSLGYSTGTGTYSPANSVIAIRREKPAAALGIFADLKNAEGTRQSADGTG
jgi:hypothetical protein